MGFGDYLFLMPQLFADVNDDTFYYEFKDADTLIEEGTFINGGIMNGPKSVRINGTFTGEIQIENDLIIGEAGIVNGPISAKNILVCGHVSGNITATETVQFTETSRVVGDVKAKSIVSDSGTVINGKFDIG